jgi:hypothetical protein
MLGDRDPVTGKVADESDRRAGPGSVDPMRSVEIVEDALDLEVR